jgi:2-polyprenyl-3-methyl-5-hydroxy-6-metoxy-1,4-benzoquinol methylase
MEIVKYNKYEIKKVESDEDYTIYVNNQNRRSGGDTNHSHFIQDLNSYGYKLDPLDNIIDVGCRGNAKVVIALTSDGYKNVYGIDIGYEAEEMWKSLNTSLHTKLKRQDVHNGLGFDLKFKCITSSHTLEHCYDPEKVMKIFYDNLEDDGILHIQIPLSKYNEYLNHGPHYSYWANENDFISWVYDLGFLTVYSIRRPLNDDFGLILKKIQ